MIGHGRIVAAGTLDDLLASDDGPASSDRLEELFIDLTSATSREGVR